MEGAYSALKSLESRPGGMKKRSMKLALPAMVSECSRDALA